MFVHTIHVANKYLSVNVDKRDNQYRTNDSLYDNFKLRKIKGKTNSSR